MIDGVEGGVSAVADEDPGLIARSNPLDVWIVTYNFFPVWAGPSLRFLRYAPGLRRRGVSPRFVTVMRPGCERVDVQDGSPVERIGSDERIHGPARFLVGATTRALRAARRPDVLVFLTIHPALYPWLLLARLFGVATVYVHTMAPELRPGRSARARWLGERARGIFHQAFDRIICSTSTLADFLEGVGVDRRRLAVIPNGVALDRFRPPTGAAEVRKIRGELQLPRDGLIVLFVGLRVERKGVFPLVQAWLRYRARGGMGTLVLVGAERREDPAASAFYERWDRLMEELPPQHGVVLRPPHPRVEEYLRAADLFVFLSALEGMPNVIAESMASGLPVLTTPFRGFSSDFGRDGQELIVTSPQVDAVATHLEKLLADSSRRRALSDNARRWVGRTQDLERALDRYSDLLAEAARQRAEQSGSNV